jgi:nitrogen fixation/metabolism regulation signal transduction histidine kinase
VVERTVANLKELMNQVAGMARPTEVRAEPCAVRELLEEAAAAAGLNGRGAGLRFALTLHGPGTVRVDRRLLLRVLVNLLTDVAYAKADPRVSYS